MDYTTINADDLRALRLDRLRELEVNHYRFILEESEEPGGNPQRAHSLVEVERRIREHRLALGLPENGSHPNVNDDSDDA